MSNYKYFVSLIFAFVTILLLPSQFLKYSTFAVGPGESCNQTSDCDLPGGTCFCIGGGSCGTGYCVGGGNGSCSCTVGGSCTPGAWSACYDCYQWRVCTNDGSLQVNSCDSGNCGGGGNPPTGTHACTVSLAPSSTSVSGLADTTYTATVTDNGFGTITGVNFSSSATGVATVSPASDNTVSYQTTATGVGFGTTTITANVQANGSTLCTTTASLTLTDWDAWWQVQNGDVVTNTNITSIVPTGSYFNIVGTNGFPGVPVYGTTFSLSGDTTQVSVNRWNANTTSTIGRIFDYEYFENLVPADITFTDASLLSTPASSQYGYEWYKATGDFTLGSNIDFGTRKVILFVDNGSDFNINARILLTDNSGFFGSFVSGDINVLSTVTGVPGIEGIYQTDGTFNTGAGTSQLHVRGSVVALTGFNLSRDLTNNATSAELFQFAPDQVSLFPEKLGYRRQKWVEVAP